MNCLPINQKVALTDKGKKKRKKKGKFKKNSTGIVLSQEDVDYLVTNTKYSSEEIAEWFRLLPLMENEQKV